MPDSKIDQIAGMLPPDLKKAWRTFLENPSSLTPREISGLLEFLREHLNLVDGARGAFERLLEMSGISSHKFKSEINVQEIIGRIKEWDINCYRTPADSAICETLL